MCKISVYWAPEKKWYDGDIVDVWSTRGYPEHTVLYEQGEQDTYGPQQRIEQLSEGCPKRVSWRFQQPPSATGAADVPLNERTGVIEERDASSARTAATAAAAPALAAAPTAAASGLTRAKTQDTGALDLNCMHNAHDRRVKMIMGKSSD